MTRLAFLPAFATRLSYRRAPAGDQYRPFSALARLSLVGLLASMTTGCLMEDPPPYTQPKQTPPRLDLQNASPPLDQIIVETTDNPITFTMPVVSEDAGDPLLAVLLLNYTAGGVPDQLGQDVVPASTLDDATREFELTWVVQRVKAGCNRFTLRVSHVNNFTNGLVDKNDVAEAYWWANLDPRIDSGTLVDCPIASSGER
jgi:hypothetical protein